MPETQQLPTSSIAPESPSASPDLSQAPVVADLPTDRNLDRSDLANLFKEQETAPAVAAPEAGSTDPAIPAESPENPEPATPAAVEDNNQSEQSQNPDAAAEATPEEGNQADPDPNPLLAELNGDDPPKESSQEESEDADKSWPKSALERVGKLTARAKTAEEQLAAAKADTEQLQTQLQQASATVLTPTTEQPLADATTPEALTKIETDARSAIDWAIANSEGGQFGEKDYTAETVAQIKANAERTLSLDLPRRREFLAARTENTAKLVEQFPSILEPGSALGNAALAEQQRYPDLMYRPDAYEVLLAISLGRQVLEKKAILTAFTPPAQPGSKKPAATPMAPPPATVDPQQPVRQPDSDPRTRAAADAEKRLLESEGTRDDLKNFFMETAAA